MTRSLRFRVTALAALVVLAVLALAGAGLLVLHRRVLVENLEEALLDRAHAVAAEVRAGAAVDPRDLRSDDVLVQVVAGGRVVAASAALAGAPPWPAADSGSRTSDGTLPGGEPARVVTVPAGAATVHVAGGLDDVADSTAALRRCGRSRRSARRSTASPPPASAAGCPSRPPETRSTAWPAR
jgi:hypothetical protein